MRSELSPLHRAFLEDHRQLVRGLTRLVQALGETNLALASEIADDIDRVVGPHMEFEERVFYPELRRSLGSQFVNRLYQEHGEGRDAICALVAHDLATSMVEEKRQFIIGQLNTALEHALSCGSLLSYLDVLSEERQETMLQELRAIRARGVRWSALREPSQVSGSDTA